MTKITYPASSPYSRTPQTNFYIGNFVWRPIPPANDDSYFTLTKTYEYRPDKLSYDLYGTPAYWWVFAVRNRDILKDPVWDLVAGVVIVTPSIATLRQVLGT